MDNNNHMVIPLDRVESMMLKRVTKQISSLKGDINITVTTNENDIILWLMDNSHIIFIEYYIPNQFIGLDYPLREKLEQYTFKPYDKTVSVDIKDFNDAISLAQEYDNIVMEYNGETLNMTLLTPSISYYEKIQYGEISKVRSVSVPAWINKDGYIKPKIEPYNTYKLYFYMLKDVIQRKTRYDHITTATIKIPINNKMSIELSGAYGKTIRFEDIEVEFVDGYETVMSSYNYKYLRIALEILRALRADAVELTFSHDIHKILEIKTPRTRILLAPNIDP